MTDLFTNEAVVAFIQVGVIDLVLAGDNAVVIGLAAAGYVHAHVTEHSQVLAGRRAVLAYILIP